MIPLAAGGLIPELQLYWGTGAVLGAAALVTAVWTVRLPAHRRRYGLLATVLNAVMAAAYVGMANGVLRYQSAGGAPVPTTRFVGYAVCFTIMIVVLGVVAGASRRLLAGMVLLALVQLGAVVGSWFLTEPESLASFSAAVVALVVLAALLLTFGSRAAAATTDERKLLYGKLRNLLLLVWGLYLVVGLVSRQGLGLLDAFVGVFLGAYLDVIVFVGFTAVLLRAGTALDDLAGPATGGDAAPEPDGNADPAD